MYPAPIEPTLPESSTVPSSSLLVKERNLLFGNLRGVQWRIDLGILPASSSTSPTIDDLRRVTANSRRRYTFSPSIFNCAWFFLGWSTLKYRWSRRYSVNVCAEEFSLYGCNMEISTCFKFSLAYMIVIWRYLLVISDWKVIWTFIMGSNG